MGFRAIWRRLTAAREPARSVTIDAPLLRVGFWIEPDSLEPRFPWPHPERLVDWNWRAEQRERILSYLSGASAVLLGLGCSPCRFPDCPLADYGNGSREHSDGEWIWPEGLAHYVRDHGVRLPEEFVQTMERNGFRPPSVECREPHPIFDSSFWLWWTLENVPRDDG